MQKAGVLEAQLICLVSICCQIKNGLFLHDLLTPLRNHFIAILLSVTSVLISLLLISLGITVAQW